MQKLQLCSCVLQDMSSSTRQLLADVPATGLHAHANKAHLLQVVMRVVNADIIVLVSVLGCVFHQDTGLHVRATKTVEECLAALLLQRVMGWSQLSAVQGCAGWMQQRSMACAALPL